MTIRAIDHFTLRTRALEQTVTFYREVVGLQEGVRPPFPFAGRWLYADGRPLLHLVASGTDEELASYLGVRGEDHGSGCIDHISLRAEGADEVQARLLRLDIPFVSRRIPEQGELQLFLQDNNGVMVELLFLDDTSQEDKR
ncbi:VOC family protein [Aeromonas veronii]|uniref:VOC family protein n=1 Tax=Aeromonas veronii TaxID=654 RepID=UPI0040553D2A